ncbi:Cna B-type domain-containing protein [Clostridiaceae bacterium 68-1-5]|uniref:Cna B-type domain-containing protein n=1 Tax=Suipraeoptans intestinalis TaxID=2606628 RepID=A0A6N7UZL5_9FIRM|nr:Cna B-type domain-containing protein [Suipraeoptans intestinalis]
MLKVDAEDYSIVLAGAVFEVTRPDGSVFELTTGTDGTVTSGFLVQGTYKVKEKIPPIGYEPNSEEYILEVSPLGGALKTISNNPIKINIAGTKIWDDANNQDGKRPGKITVNLLKNGNSVKSVEITLGAAGEWKYSFNDLRKYENGQEIKYTITENAVAEYTSQISGYNITNSHTPEVIKISGEKTWNDTDNQDGKRPEEITINLLKNGTKIDSKVVKKSDGWKWKFEGLDKYENG